MARILGLDIDSSALRAAVVRTSLRKIEVEHYLHIPLDIGTATSAPEVRAATLRAGMSGLAQVLQQPPSAVIVAFEGHHVSLRRLSLPRAVEKRVTEVLAFELESQLPFEPERAVIDHQVIARTPTEVDLLVAAALHEHVNAALAQLNDAGIDPRELCPAPLYLENLAQHVEHTGCSLVLELRQEATEIALMQDGRCLMARSINALANTSSTALETFFRSLQLTLTSFRAAGSPHVDNLILVGPRAETPSLDSWLSERLQLPLAALHLPPTVGGRAGGPDFARAVGLALRGARGAKHINFRKGALSQGSASPQWAKHGNLLAGCAVAVLVALMFSLKAKQSLLLDEQAALQHQLAETTKVIFGKSASTIESAELLLKNPKGGDPLPRFDALDALEAVSSAVSEDIEHELRRLRIEIGDDKHEGHLEMQGLLASIEQRDAIATKLEEHPCFSDIEKGKTTSGRGQSEISYQLEAVVQCPGEGTTAKKKRKAARSEP